MPVTINVTQADIDAARAWADRVGLLYRSDHCPIYYALERAYGMKRGQSDFIHVRTDRIYLYRPDTVSLGLPEAARNFALAHDQGLAVRPFSFDLDIDRLPDVAVVR